MALGVVLEMKNNIEKITLLIRRWIKMLSM
jgi:hypothetical protein